MRLLLAAVIAAWTIACADPPPPELPRAVTAQVDFPVVPRPPCDERLAAALQGADPPTVRRLVADGAAPNCGGGDSFTALSEAILFDRVDVVRALLEAGASPNLRWSSHGDRLPLQDVVEGGALFGMRQVHRAEILALLIRHGADMDARWCPFESRLPTYRHEGTGRRLVTPGCTAAGGVTALRMAAQLGQADSVAQLLAAGAAADWRDEHGLTAVDVAATADIFGLIMVHHFGSEASAVADYQRRSPGIEGPAIAGRTMLTSAVSHRYYGLVRLELSVGADPDRPGGEGAGGMTPLQFAVVHRWDEGVKLLLDFGADIEGRSCPAQEWLRSYGAGHVDMGGCDSVHGLTPLMVAAAAKTPVGVFGRDGSFSLLSSTAVDWRGRSARRHAQLSGVAPDLLHNYGR